MERLCALKKLILRDCGGYPLIHLGTHPDRTDKFYNRLGDLIQELKARGYRMVRF